MFTVVPAAPMKWPAARSPKAKAPDRLSVPLFTVSVPLFDQLDDGVTLRLVPLLVMLPALVSVPGFSVAEAPAATLTVPVVVLVKVPALTVNASNQAQVDTAKKNRVYTAAFLTVISPEFQVQK